MLQQVSEEIVIVRSKSSSHSQKGRQNTAQLSVAVAQEIEPLFYHFRIELGHWLGERFEYFARALPYQVLDAAELSHPVLGE